VFCLDDDSTIVGSMLVSKDIRLNIWMGCYKNKYINKWMWSR